jgi:hypothetical protein
VFARLFEQQSASPGKMRMQSTLSNTKLVSYNDEAAEEKRDDVPFIRSQRVMGLPTEAVAGAAFCTASTSMILLNKAALSSYHFTSPTCLLLFQCIVTLLLVLVWQGLGYTKLQALDLQLVRVWLPVNFLFVGMVWTSFYALKYVGVAMVGGACLPAPAPGPAARCEGGGCEGGAAAPWGTQARARPRPGAAAQPAPSAALPPCPPARLPANQVTVLKNLTNFLVIFGGLGRQCCRAGMAAGRAAPHEPAHITHPAGAPGGMHAAGGRAPQGVRTARRPPLRQPLRPPPPPQGTWRSLASATRGRSGSRCASCWCLPCAGPTRTWSSTCAATPGSLSTTSSPRVGGGCGFGGAGVAGGGARPASRTGQQAEGGWGGGSDRAPHALALAPHVPALARAGYSLALRHTITRMGSLTARKGGMDEFSMVGWSGGGGGVARHVRPRPRTTAGGKSQARPG